jgi:hypothetical protein
VPIGIAAAFAGSIDQRVVGFGSGKCMNRFILAVIGTALVVAAAGLATAEANAATNGPAGAHAVAVNSPVVQEGANGDRVRTIQLLLNQHVVHVIADGLFGKSLRPPSRIFRVRTTQRSMAMLAQGRGKSWSLRSSEAIAAKRFEHFSTSSGSSTTTSRCSTTEFAVRPGRRP